MQDLPASPASAVSGRGRRFGPWQAVWVVLGFGLVQFFGGLFAVFARGIGIGVIAGLRHEHAHVPPASPQFLALAAIAAYALAGLWCYRFVRRRAGALLHDGGPSGIGLCPAPRASYAAAVGLAVALVGVVTLLFRFVPPDRRAAPQLLFARALAGSLESHLLLLALILTLILFVGPLVEEFVFRGAAPAGLIGRFGTVGAGAITTLLFAAAHAPEKLHYPAGFIDVALMAVAALWLRLRYRSLRPAVLCHALYNFGVIWAATLLR